MVNLVAGPLLYIMWRNAKNVRVWAKHFVSEGVNKLNIYRIFVFLVETVECLAEPLGN